MSTVTSSAPTLEQLQNLVPRVLRRLEGVAKLPPHGTVAGQAVASALWEGMGLPIKGPIKDIDVFVSPGLPRPMRGLESMAGNGYLKESFLPSARILGTTSHHRDLAAEYDSYERIKFIAARLSLRILHTYQAGLLNFTLINSPRIGHGEHTHDTEVSQELVDGFDLNAVGVGINLDTGQLVASEGFMEFLKTRELKAQTCNTPAHTLIRLARKYHNQEIQGATCNYDEQRATLELAMACQDAWGFAHPDRELGSVTKFGARYKKSYDQLSQYLPACQEHLEWDSGRQAGGQNPKRAPYTLYKLIPRSEWEPGDAALLEWAGLEDGGLGPLVAPPALVSEFPRLRELLNPTRSGLDEKERQRRLEGLEAMHVTIPGREKHAQKVRDSHAPLHNEELDLAHVHGFIQATGRPNPTPHMPSMADEERTAFFFNQKCALHPTLVSEVVQAWEELGNLEQDMVLAMDLRADWVHQSKTDPLNAWRGLVDERGDDLLALLAVKAGQEDLSANARALMNKALEWIKKPSRKNRAVRQLMSPAHNLTQAPSPLFGSVIRALDPTLQVSTAHRIMRWHVPRWPDTSQLDSTVRNRAILMWAQSGLTLPKKVLDSIDSIDFNETMTLMETLSGGLNVGGGHAGENLKTGLHHTLTHLLTHLPASQWLQDDVAVVRGSVFMGASEAIAQATKNIGENPAIDQALEIARQELQERAANPADKYSPQSRTRDFWWARDYNLDRMTAPLDRILRERQLEKALPTPKASHQADWPGAGEIGNSPPKKPRM